MNDPTTVYNKFIEFEEQAASIYFKMASRFSPDNPDLSLLWLDMGIQEKQHAGLLQFCVTERLFAESAPTEEQVRSLERAFAELAKRAADPDLSISNAFEIAVEMEMSEVNDIYCNLTTPLHSSNYLLKRKTTASLPDHATRLLHEGKTFGAKESTLKVLERAVMKSPS